MENINKNIKLNMRGATRQLANKSIHSAWSKGKQIFIILGALIALLLIFTIIEPNFLGKIGFASMSQKLAPYAIMALGVTFVIATGGIDLSIGTVCIASASIAGGLLEAGMPLALTIPVMLIVGLLFGILNGLLIAKLKMPAFIATLGTMMVSRGLSAIIVNKTSVLFPNTGWSRELFTSIGDFPIGLMWVLALTAICMYLMYKCKIGRYILSIGSNEEATRLSGINTDRYKMYAYMISGLFAGIAAIFWVAVSPTIQPGGGNGMELDAIAGVYIGGTSAAGGIASIAGSLIGSAILVVLSTGLTQACVAFGIPINTLYLTYTVTGLVVVFAVYLDVVKNKNQAKVKIVSQKTNYLTEKRAVLESMKVNIDYILSDRALADEVKNAQSAALIEKINICKKDLKIENLQVGVDAAKVSSLKADIATAKSELKQFYAENKIELKEQQTVRVAAIREEMAVIKAEMAIESVNLKEIDNEKNALLAGIAKTSALEVKRIKAESKAAAKESKLLQAWKMDDETKNEQLVVILAKITACKAVIQKEIDLRNFDLIQSKKAILAEIKAEKKKDKESINISLIESKKAELVEIKAEMKKEKKNRDIAAIKASKLALAAAQEEQNAFFTENKSVVAAERAETERLRKIALAEAE